MLKLNASYSKKVPVEGADFSSQSYHAAVEVEVPDGLEPNELSGRIHDTFSLVRDSVEKELHGSQQKPQQPRQIPRSNGPRNGSRNKSGQPASEKQVSYLRDIAVKRGMTIQQLNDEAHTRFGVETVRQLERSQASKLIDSLAVVSGAPRRRAA